MQLKSFYFTYHVADSSCFHVIAKHVVASSYFVSCKSHCCAVIMFVISQNILLFQAILFQVLASHIVVLS